MSNTYFQFKQFKIEQDKCAMKVCTDSCLFGAWLHVEENVKTILDIGCGTGLLTLMLAQKSAAKIDAVEIDASAYLQAKQNIESSIFSNNISIFNEDILQFSAHENMI
ncbi:MAG: methyltransferase domain-containing protein [Saprospirales bacterium]|nr:methyltransferase domain-containing protein [Saprospirales bacterium]